MSRQCRLLGLSKAAYYYRARERNELNEALMTLLDEQYTKTPFYGVPKMTEWLRTRGYMVNRKRVRRLMKILGLEAVYPKPWLSKPAKDHKKYPYLLKDVVIERPDHVWSTDITYIRLKGGFIYLVAIMDWHSRYVLSWEVSTTLDAEFCIRALERALSLSSPDIFNSDQGSQFTSVEFTERLEKLGVAISMDGRGRAMDNIFVERLWRTVKYEEVYLKSYETVKEARESLARYFHFYNTERLHQALDYRTPQDVYFKERNIRKDSETKTKPRQALLHHIQPSFLS
ncbi:Putative transposase InsK for insertion sequence element IS150 [uncultured bacterium]|nr:Putative transposase InsK for insertion sequence element IS150 [uncultured bacterium]